MSLKFKSVIKNKTIEIQNIAEEINKKLLRPAHFKRLTNPRFQKIKERYRKELGFDQGDTARAIFKGLRVPPAFIRWISGLSDSVIKLLLGEQKNYSRVKRKLVEACNDIDDNHEILKFIVYTLMRSNNLYLTEIALISGSGYRTVRDCANFLKKRLKIKIPSSVDEKKNRPQDKYVVYAIMYSTDRLTEIASDSGASISIVRHSARYLSLTRSPSLKSFYLKDYEQRFPPGRT